MHLSAQELLRPTVRVPVVIQLYFLLSATVVLVSSALILVVALELSTQCPQMRATSCTRMELLVNEDQLDLFPIIIPPVTMPRKAKSLCCRFKGAVAINKKPHFYPNYPVLEKNDHKQTKPNTHTHPVASCTWDVGIIPCLGHLPSDNSQHC